MKKAIRVLQKMHLRLIQQDAATSAFRNALAPDDKEGRRLASAALASLARQLREIKVALDDLDPTGERRLEK